MKIVVTGSLGNISRPLAEELIAKGHSVTVISSSPEKQKEIESLGAKAAIGTMEDVAFLTKTFKGADAVYCMETFGFFNPDFDYIQYISQIAHNYKDAIEASAIKKVIHLSSIGAHTSEGVGILKFHHLAERIMNQLSEDIVIKFIRPVGFYVNLLGQIPTIKSQGIIVSNFGNHEKEPWVSPYDIADVIAEEFGLPFNQRKIRYVASDEVSAIEIAETLGKAIEQPDLKWVTVTDEQYLDSLLNIGMNKQIAEDYVAMQAAQRTGSIYEDFNNHKPTFGKVKFSDFAKEFTAIYNQ
ncbi:NAD(P)H-binding protein [Autumnicola musiva]|uniref:NAD(P)H-binding protein n=1 Tax=Autumnicola musiva TaxID=3075589 RepID=A0ABU3D879_9FLAO|nr:NAD(P)H-binding protein [Zunongwangia sp. F117]MDT0677661.1 NAD(P)H-binding protein [Zunongwangia sp. F117]